MVHIHLKRHSSASPEAVLDTLREISPQPRHEAWANVTPRYFELHASGQDFIEVTEATLPVGRFWERSRYEWKQPDRVLGTVLDSNVFRPGSTWDLRARPRGGGGSEVELIVERRYQSTPQGCIAGVVNHLGGHRLFGWYLGTMLRSLERRQQASP